MDGWTAVGGNGHSDGFEWDRGRGGEPVTHRVGCGTSEKWDMPHQTKGSKHIHEDLDRSYFICATRTQEKERAWEHDKTHINFCNPSGFKFSS